jgi:ABC-2 type transport system permease protein
MIEDVGTVLWEEAREFIVRQGSIKGFVIRYALSLGIMGVYMPYYIWRSLVEQPFMLLVYVWVSMFMGIGIVLDSFAGERERHTLETLLASRLSDRAILFGKISFAVLYGFVMTLAQVLLGLVTVNVAFWNGQIAVYRPETFVLIILAVLLVNVFFTTVGVLVSLRATTVRQGSEMLMMAMIATAAAPVILFFVMPDAWKTGLQDWLVTTDITLVGLVAMAALLLACIVALYGTICLISGGAS